MELSSSPETSLPKVFTDCELPEGWKRLQVTRNGGASRGKIDTYYIDPQKKKYRSKVQLIKYFGNTLDLSDFDYRTGKRIKSSPSSLRKPLTSVSPKSFLTGRKSNGVSPSSSIASLCSNGKSSTTSSLLSSPASTTSLLTKAKSPRTAKTMLAVHKARVAHTTTNSSLVAVGGSVSVPSSVKPSQPLLCSQQGLAMSLKADSSSASLMAAAASRAAKRKLEYTAKPETKDHSNGTDVCRATISASTSAASRRAGRSKSLNGTILTPEQITDAILTTLNIKDGFNLDGDLSVAEIILQLAARIVETPESLLSDVGEPIVVQSVTEEDIRAQEAVVEQYRRKLSEAIAVTQGGPSN